MTHAEKIEADVVIVGSGVAGALTACRLAQAGIGKIVIVEAGPRIDRAKTVRSFQRTALLDASAGFPNPDWAPRPDWADVNDKSARAASYIEQTGPVPLKSEYLRVVGGTTWHWGGMTPRHLPGDFRLRSAYGVGVDWPISYDTLEPFYTEAEYELGVAGDSGETSGSWRSRPYPLPPVPFAYCDKLIDRELRKEGMPLSHRPAGRATAPYKGRSQCQGFGTCSPICPSGAQYAAIYHVEEAEKLGVRILDNTRVDKLNAGGTVTSAEAMKSDGTKLSLHGKIFVLAANGIETPRLLLMSAGESSPRGIANSSGQVGRNFMEHPMLVSRLTLAEPMYAGRGPQSLSACMAFRDGDFRKHRPSCVVAIENRVHFDDIANDLLNKGVGQPGLDSAIRERAAREVEIDIVIEQLPEDKNGITLDWSRRDRAGQPLIRQYYSLSDYEQAGLAFAKETIKRVAKVLKAEIVFSTGPVPQHHLMGMTRMGDDPKTSVADSFGRSHDHGNLFMLSAALFPSGGTANPTLTLAALCLRAAGEIARQLGSRKT